MGGTLELQIDREGQLKFTRSLLNRRDRFPEGRAGPEIERSAAGVAIFERAPG